MRYSKNFSPIFQLYLQNLLQMNRVKNTVFSDPEDSSYMETVFNLGPTLNYTPSNLAYTLGVFNNLTFRSVFEKVNNLIQPFASVYYNPSQALSLGLRTNFSFNPSDGYNFLSILAEVVYRFGSRVPDTLRTTFLTTTQIKGYIFVDGNDDGQYQEGEKLIPEAGVILNGSSKKSIDGSFDYKANSGVNSVFIELPKAFKNYQFGTANPAELNLVSGETRVLYFGISQRIPVGGKVLINDKQISSKGFEGAKIEVTGPNYRVITTSSISGTFNVFVPEPGKYTFKLIEMDLPAGYKTVSESKYEINILGGKMNKTPDFVLDGKRLVIGRVFVDHNQNGSFDDADEPIVGMKVKLGSYSTTTEDDGSFSVTYLPSGSYTVVIDPSYKSYQLRPFNDRIMVPGVGTVELNITYAK